MDILEQLEQSVIGAVLLQPSTLDLLPTLETGDFQRVAAKYAWSAIRNLEAKGAPIDVVTVGDEIQRTGCDATSSMAWLGECAIMVPTVTHAIEYARRLREASLKRRLLQDLAQLSDAKDDDSVTGAELLTRSLAVLSRLDAEQPESSSTIGEIIKRRIGQLEEIARQRETGERTLTGFPTGVAKLDEKIGGWQAGIVSIVAARPGMGKSSLGLATADACSAAGFGAHLFSLEDTESAYADRALSRTSGVHAESLRNTEMQKGDMGRLNDAMRSLRKRKGWLVDGRSGITADEVVRSVRRRKRENATQVVIVDYVQLVKRPSRMSGHEALSEIVTTFADAAKQDGLAYVVMSQLNRELEKRDDKRPQLADLRESGSLEERAKCVVGVYRGSVYGKPRADIDYDPKTQSQPSEAEHARQVQLLVLKNSNGRTGLIRATWDGPTTRIE